MNLFHTLSCLLPALLIAGTGPTPAEAPHGYANVGDTPGRMLMLLHAGSRMEDFFRTIGTRIDAPSRPPAMEGPPDMDRFAAVMAEYDMRCVEQPQF